MALSANPRASSPALGLVGCPGDKPISSPASAASTEHRALGSLIYPAGASAQLCLLGADVEQQLDPGFSSFLPTLTTGEQLGPRVPSPHGAARDSFCFCIVFGNSLGHNTHGWLYQRTNLPACANQSLPQSRRTGASIAPALGITHPRCVPTSRSEGRDEDHN